MAGVSAGRDDRHRERPHVVDGGQIRGRGI